MSDIVKSSDITTPPGAVITSPKASRLSRRERGMATVEYAIGLLAAAAVALVLLRIFNDNSFFQTLFDWVVNIIKKVPLPGR